MDLQFLPTPAHDRDAVEADRGPRRWPGKSNLTSRMAAAPQLILRVANDEAERALHEVFGRPHAPGPARTSAPVQRAAAPSDDPFAVHLGRSTLAVSTPHDAAEHEADRAADAMVRGAPAQVTGASGVARTIQREHDPYSSGESWQAQDDVEWNQAYADKYKKKGGKRSADQDFEEQRNSGKVKSASEQSPKATKVKTTITSDQLTRIVSAGGEKDSATRIAGMAGGISGAFETMLIDTAQAQADYIAHMAGETGGILEEKQGEKRSYAPFQGRGAVQLTHAENYAKVLGTLQQRADQLDRQISDLADQANTLKIERDKAKDKDAKKKVEDKIDAIHKQMEPLKKQLGELYEAINAVKADPGRRRRPALRVPHLGRGDAHEQRRQGHGLDGLHRQVPGQRRRGLVGVGRQRRQDLRRAPDRERERAGRDQGAAEGRGARTPPRPRSSRARPARARRSSGT
jgi:chaperonin cofactor prefoldin